VVTNKAFRTALPLPTNQRSCTDEVLVKISVGTSTGLRHALTACSQSRQ